MNFTRAASECLAYVQEIIEKYGPRFAGTKACHDSAEEVKNRLAPLCDSVSLEPFVFHPGAFTGFMKILAAGYAVITVCAFFGGYWLLPAMFMYLVCCLSALGEFVMYREVLDPFYKKAAGYNVAGVISPGGEIKQQVIVGGHHDSASVFNFMVHLQKWYSIRIVTGLLFVNIAGFLVFIWGVLFLAGKADPMYVQYLRIALVIGLVPVLPFYFFINRTAVPGAGDNLIATAIAWKLAGIFGSAKKSGKPLLENTRLIFLSTDAEEHGLRGARAYVKRHKQELLSLPTYVLNIDSLYTLKELKCLTSEINGFLKTSKVLAQDCRRIAGELGYRLEAVPIAFGGGATDAAEFAKIGVEATCILGLSTHYVREGMVYHTMDDTVDKIEHGIVEAVLKIVYGYILRKDAEIHAAGSPRGMGRPAGVKGSAGT